MYNTTNFPTLAVVKRCYTIEMDRKKAAISRKDYDQAFKNRKMSKLWFSILETHIKIVIK